MDQTTINQLMETKSQIEKTINEFNSIKKSLTTWEQTLNAAQFSSTLPTFRGENFYFKVVFESEKGYPYSISTHNITATPKQIMDFVIPLIQQEIDNLKEKMNDIKCPVTSSPTA